MKDTLLENQRISYRLKKISIITYPIDFYHVPYPKYNSDYSNLYVLKIIVLYIKKKSFNYIIKNKTK